MLVSLPPEILDLIVDNLRDDEATLESCCLVSKSWISRTRRHLFAHVEFESTECPIHLWMKTFQDPSNSPTCYTRRLDFFRSRRDPCRGHLRVCVDSPLQQYRRTADKTFFARLFKRPLRLATRIVTSTQTPPFTPSHHTTLRISRPYLFLSPSRGYSVIFGCHHRQRPWVGHSLDPTEIHWDDLYDPRYPLCRAWIIASPKWSQILQN